MLPGTRASRFVAGFFKTPAGIVAILLGSGVVAAFDADLDTSFSSNGLAHSGFNPSLPGVINAVAVQPDGMIVLAGTSATASDTELAAVARFHGDEALVFTDGFELGSSAWWSVTIN